MRRTTAYLPRTRAGQWLLGAILSCSILSGTHMVAAQSLSEKTASDLRDPTLAPVAASSAMGSAPTTRAARTLALVSRPLMLIERDGQRYVVLEGRLYTEGQNFGLIHLERVRETEVWFRDGTALYKMSRFPGIERRAVADVTAAVPAAPPVAPPAKTGLPYSHLPR
jgi:hypothetical protein